MNTKVKNSRSNDRSFMNRFVALRAIDTARGSRSLGIKIGIVTAALVLASVAGTSALYAQTAEGNDSFIQKLAQKLGVGEDKVRTAVTEIHNEGQADREARFEERLSQAVTTGAITEAQKQLIINKSKELQQERQSTMEQFKNMTPEERKAAMDKKRAELETWAKENSIDMKYLMFGGMRGHHGMGKWGFGPKPSGSPTPTN